MIREVDKFAERAAEARREASEATLANVRDRCLRAAEAWEVMAERTRAFDDRRAAQAREKETAEPPSAVKWPDNLELKKPRQNEPTTPVSNS